MGKALYRLYRPKRLDEVVGQSHIITTLRNALKNGAISHAYLFTGPKGVGKTSIARILAHEVNDLPYNEDTTALDIIEIDAASNRRIDEIRDLRDKVHLAPAQAKYKVYIIDEVHMLTREAFNALLKTLEEPPAHAIFILATTEVHKLPDTIISRTQRFTFKPIDPLQAVAHLRTIADQEKIQISDEALALIAAHGAGSFRDSISLLDQISSGGGPVSADDLRSMLGIAPHSMIDQLYQSTFSGTPQQIIEQLQIADQKGYEASHLARQLSQLLRQNLLNGSLTQPLAGSQLLKQLIEVPTSHDPAVYLEVTLLECNLNLNPTPQPPATITDPPTTKRRPTAPPANQPDMASNPPAATSFDDIWPAVLTSLKQKHNTLYSVLRMAQPSLQEQTLTLAFQFAFHQKRLNQAKNKQLVAELVSQHLGQPVTIQCTLQSDLTLPIPLVGSDPSEPDPPAQDHLSTISNIFGTAEVLE